MLKYHTISLDCPLWADKGWGRGFRRRFRRFRRPPSRWWKQCQHVLSRRKKFEIVYKSLFIIIKIILFHNFTIVWTLKGYDDNYDRRFTYCFKIRETFNSKHWVKSFPSQETSSTLSNNFYEKYLLIDLGVSLSCIKKKPINDENSLKLSHWLQPEAKQRPHRCWLVHTLKIDACNSSLYHQNFSPIYYYSPGARRTLVL